MTDFASPVLRLVQGSVLRGMTKNRKGEPLTDKHGQPRTSFFLAGAYPKTAASAGGAWWNEGEFFTAIYREGMRGYPQFFNADGSCKKRDFSWKVIDGDGFDDDGVDNKTKQGFAGHWVVRFSNGFCPQLWMNGANCVNPDAVKTGYFIRVIGDMKDNSPSESPGVYLNHSGVEFIAYGEEIISGPNVGAIFAQMARPTALPTGATLTPPAPAVSTMPAPAVAGPAQGMPLAMPGSMPAPTMPPGAPQMAPAGPAVTLPPMPGSMPAPSNITPNHSFVQNVIAPAAPAMPAPPPAAPAGPVYQMTQLAGGFTREQYNAQGWTDEALIAGGQMIRTA